MPEKGPLMAAAPTATPKTPKKASAAKSKSTTSKSAAATDAKRQSAAKKAAPGAAGVKAPRKQPAAIASDIAEPPALTKTQAVLYRRLQTERDDLRRRLASLEREQVLLPRDPESDSKPGDQELGDCFQSREIARDAEIAAQVSDMVDKVEKAIVRIESGRYGVCDDCGKKIPAARLQALPSAGMCLTCQARRERFFGA